MTAKHPMIPFPVIVRAADGEEQHEIRAYCENNERQAFDEGFKTAVQHRKQHDKTGGIMK